MAVAQRSQSPKDWYQHCSRWAKYTLARFLDNVIILFYVSCSGALYLSSATKKTTICAQLHKNYPANIFTVWHVLGHNQLSVYIHDSTFTVYCIVHVLSSVDSLLYTTRIFLHRSIHLWPVLMAMTSMLEKAVFVKVHIVNLITWHRLKKLHGFPTGTFSSVVARKWLNWDQILGMLNVKLRN